MNNKSWAVPLPSSPEILANKDIPIRTYALLMLYSNWGGSKLNNNTRYLYDNKLSDNINEILSQLNISRNTFRKHLQNLRKYSKSIFKPKMVNNELVYMLTPNDHEGKNFILIDSETLLRLICHYNENCIRIYIILCYVCRNGPTKITHECLSCSIGNSSNSRRLVYNAANNLESLNFIAIERIKTTHKRYLDNTDRIICTPKDVHIYSLVNN